ncbi:hypothetical protein TNCV_2166321 [Trichonephila clavipes]|nr:hypothetical protein TNCV_2166321 [Trichonephila clavipes]
MANLGDQLLPPTNPGRVDEEMVPPSGGITLFKIASTSSDTYLRGSMDRLAYTFKDAKYFTHAGRSFGYSSNEILISTRVFRCPYKK